MTSQKIISSIERGIITIGGDTFKDVKLFPNHASEWNWALDGTHHSPGITKEAVASLMENGCNVIVLGIGMCENLNVSNDAKEYCNDADVELIVLEASEAVAKYNSLVMESGEEKIVGALIHSTC